jgi:hypothetical protein
MSSSDCSGPSSPSSDDPVVEPIDLDLIERLAVALVDNLGGGDPDEAEALSIGILPGDTDGFGVAVHPLLGADPIDALIGFDAPADWVAVGVVSTARWAPTTDEEATAGRLRRASRPVGGRARLAHIVTRQGRSLVVLRQNDDPPVIRRFNPRDVHFGRVDDVCRRVLGLSTATPANRTAELWAVVWADRLVRWAAAGDDLTWDDVARAHPAVAHLAVEDHISLDEAADDLIGSGEWLADRWSWDDLRKLTVEGDHSVDDLDPEDARWMDAGMFSRWALAPFSELSDLLADLDDLLPEALVRRVRTTCRAWGLR